VNFFCKAKQYLLQGAKTCKLKFFEHFIIKKKTKAKFDTVIHCTKGILDYVHTNEDLPRRYLLEITTTLCLLLMITLGDIGYMP